MLIVPDNNVSNLKRRTLSLLGIHRYNEGGQDVPSREVDACYGEVLREFLSVFQWTWAVLKVASEPQDVLVMHWHRVLSDGSELWCYVPDSLLSVPDAKPDCQVAFCYLLAARIAMIVTGRAEFVSLMEQRADHYIADARYKDAYEICLAGDGAITNFYKMGGRK